MEALGDRASLLAKALGELQAVVQELQSRVLIPQQYLEDGIPKHGSPVPLFQGQVIHLTSRGKSSILEVAHGLGRPPVGGFFLLQSSLNEVMIEGDQTTTPPTPPADEETVFVKMAGPAGEKAILILV